MRRYRGLPACRRSRGLYCRALRKAGKPRCQGRPCSSMPRTDEATVTSLARTMRAMQAASPDPASLSCQRVPVPSPGPGEVLVDVHATAVTAGELTWPETWPTIPCHDVSGVVAAAGRGVAGWRPGDEVYGLIGFDRPGLLRTSSPSPPLIWPPSPPP